jgi:hypothetical protein
MTDAAVRDAAETAPCYIALANHARLLGIGEVVYTLYSTLGSACVALSSRRLVADGINVIIDEFSDDAFVNELFALKRAHPRTRIVVVATEFVSRIEVAGIGLGTTFNFFGEWSDWRSWIGNHVPRSWRPRPYLYQRYEGFRRVLAITDLLVSVHPLILKSLEYLPRAMIEHVPCVEVYPYVDLSQIDRRRLVRLPFGFTMTGTRTPYRQALADRLVRIYRAECGERPIFGHGGFRNSIVDTGGRIKFLYDKDDGDYLFNINPPQKLNWGFSSPMRILRAALLGQIPLVTRKFGDHAIEDIAILWDESDDGARRLFAQATAGRDRLVDDYIASVRRYNDAARQKNAALLAALNAP